MHFHFKLLYRSAEKPNNICTSLNFCLVQTIIQSMVKANMPMSVLKCACELVNNLVVSSDLHVNFSSHLFSFDPNILAKYDLNI